jgi:PAS domain S-box-containing protein
MASLIKLKRGEPIKPRQIFHEYGWLMLAYAASASIACLLNIAFGQFEVSVIFAAAPIIAALLAALHVYFRHAVAEARVQTERLTAAERAAAETAKYLVELRDSEDRFQSAFTHAAIGMLLVSAEGRIIEVNAALARLLGQSEAEFGGMELSQIVHPDDNEALRTEMLAIVRGKETTFRTELRCRHHQGIDVWISVSGSFFTARGRFRVASSCSSRISARGGVPKPVCSTSPTTMG